MWRLSGREKHTFSQHGLRQLADRGVLRASSARPRATPTTPAPAPPSVHNGEFDRRLFLSAEAAEIYFARCDKGFIYERGLKPMDHANPEIYHIIGFYDWGDFCELSKLAYKEWVRKFYTNIPKFDAQHSWVRGHRIEYDPEAINRLFHSPTPREATPPVSFEQLNGLRARGQGLEE